MPVPSTSLARRLGEDDLPAVRGRRDPRRPVHVHAHVTLVGDDRLTGVEPHARVDEAGRERCSGLVRRCDRVRRPREHDEEGVALRVDLDPSVPGECFPQRAPVLGEELCVPGPVLLEQPRRIPRRP